MGNVTKIKFQYFKPLEKGTEERKEGGRERRAAAGTLRRPRGRGSEARKGRDLLEGRGLPGGAPLPRGGQRRPDSRLKGSGTPRTGTSRCLTYPPARATPCQRRRLRDPGDPSVSSEDTGTPTRQQRLPRERPSAPGARGKSPSTPMSERLPHDGHAGGAGLPTAVPEFREPPLIGLDGLGNTVVTSNQNTTSRPRGNIPCQPHPDWAVLSTSGH